MTRTVDVRDLVPIARRAAREFVRDEAFTLSAALAFHAVLALAPLMIVLVSVSGWLGPAAQADLVSRIREIAGPFAGETVGIVVEAARARPHARGPAAAAGLLLVLAFASSFFAQLQAALNRIWNVRSRPGQGWRGFLRKRLLSLGMVVGLASLLLASIAASAVLDHVLERRGSEWAGAQDPIMLALYTAVFAMLFRYLPDVQIAWRDTWAGALATALLFAAGKWAIGRWLAWGSVGSAHGAAGSFVVLLAWVQYSSLIFFYGAELTQAWAHHRGAPIEPDRHAERMGGG